MPAMPDGGGGMPRSSVVSLSLDQESTEETKSQLRTAVWYRWLQGTSDSLPGEPLAEQGVDATHPKFMHHNKRRSSSFPE